MLFVDVVHVLDTILEGKGQMKVFRGCENITRRQINTFFIKSLVCMQHYVDDYDAYKLGQDDAIEQWSAARRPKGPRPRRAEPIDVWVRNVVQIVKDNGEDVPDEVLDVSVGCDFQYQTFSKATLHNRHFRTHEKDIRRRTFDSGVGCRYHVRGSSYEDFVGILQEILEVNFRSLGKQVIFRVKWYQNTTLTQNDCLFPSIDHTQTYACDSIEDQPFVLPKDVEQVFFAPDNLNHNRSFILQSNPRVYLLFDYLEPKDFDNGSHVTGLLAGRNFPSNMPRELEDDSEGDESMTTDTSDGEPHEVNCTLDDECTDRASNNDIDDDIDEDNNRMRYIYLCCSFQ